MRVLFRRRVFMVGGGSTDKAGDTIEYQLNFQVSDYFALNNVTLEDILSDGQELDTSFTPTISFQQQANGTILRINHSTQET